MPNRWIRVNGVLTPKIAPKGVDQEDVVVLADYTFTDDFNYANQTATALVWTVAAEGAYATNATGIKLTTGATATQTGGILKLGANNFIDPTKKVTFKFRGAVTDSIVDMFSYIGLFETAPTDADPPVEADDAIGFRVLTGETNWFAITATDLGTTDTIIDTGVALDLLVHDFEFTLDDGTATFKIDGVQVAKTSLTLPVATDLIPIVKVTAGASTDIGLTLDVLSVINSRT